MENNRISCDWSDLVKVGSIVQHAFLNDDFCLERMRDMMKSYVAANQECKLGVSERQQRQDEFNHLRCQLSDPMLREFSSFEFMERLYIQEYSVQAEWF
jgi:hypothetical protein